MTEPAWLASGKGEPPKVRWSFSTDAPLHKAVLAREAGECLTVDQSGGMYLLDRDGQIVSVSRGFANPGSMSISDAGHGGAISSHDTKLCFFNRRLEVVWTVDLWDTILAVAVSPHGGHVVVSLANGENLVFDAAKNRVAKFETMRPLAFLSFLATEATIVGAAEYGLLCAHSLAGEPIWAESLWSTVGDFAITGDGKHIYLAGFAHGIQAFDKTGTSRGAYLVEGTPNRVATSFVADRLAITTLERHIYWLDAAGNLLWAAGLPEDPCTLACDPLGRGLLCGLTSGRLFQLRW